MALKNSRLRRDSRLIQLLRAQLMMSDRVVAQEPLFYEFASSGMSPRPHLLRSTVQFADLSGLRAQLRPFYSETRWPSVDPC
jgi:hypothetical protein